jgi:hypothetical protein
MIFQHTAWMYQPFTDGQQCMYLLGSRWDFEVRAFLRATQSGRKARYVVQSVLPEACQPNSAYEIPLLPYSNMCA